MPAQKGTSEFFLGDLPVGILAGNGGRPGRWRYEPYRGPGHYELATRIRAGESVECYAVDERGRVEFLVAAMPDYGVLEVTKVAISKLTRLP